MELFPGPVWHLGADEVGFPDLKDSPDEDFLIWKIVRMNTMQIG